MYIPRDGHTLGEDRRPIFPAMSREDCSAVLPVGTQGSHKTTDRRVVCKKEKKNNPVLFVGEKKISEHPKVTVRNLFPHCQLVC